MFGGEAFFAHEDYVADVSDQDTAGHADGEFGPLLFFANGDGGRFRQGTDVAHLDANIFGLCKPTSARIGGLRGEDHAGASAHVGGGAKHVGSGRHDSAEYDTKHGVFELGKCHDGRGAEITISAARCIARNIEEGSARFFPAMEKAVP